MWILLFTLKCIIYTYKYICSKYSAFGHEYVYTCVYTKVYHIYINIWVQHIAHLVGSESVSTGVYTKMVMELTFRKNSREKMRHEHSCNADVYTCIYIYEVVCIYMMLYMYTYIMSVYIMHMYIYICSYIHMHMYIYIINVYICIYIL